MSMSGKHGTERCLRCGGCLWLPMAKLPATYGKASCCSFLLPAAASCYLLQLPATCCSFLRCGGCLWRTGKAPMEPAAATYAAVDECGG